MKHLVLLVMMTSLMECSNNSASVKANPEVKVDTNLFVSMFKKLDFDTLILADYFTDSIHWSGQPIDMSFKSLFPDHLTDCLVSSEQSKYLGEAEGRFDIGADHEGYLIGSESYFHQIQLFIFDKSKGGVPSNKVAGSDRYPM